MDILNTQKASLKATFLLADGLTETTTLGSSPVWSSTDASIMALVPSADGFTCEAICGANQEGNVTVTVSANADLLGGDRQVSGSVNFDVANPVVVVPEAMTATVTVTGISDQ